MAKKDSVLGALAGILGISIDSMEEDQARDDRAREIALSDDPPTWCIRCGFADLDQDICPSCDTDRRKMHKILKILYAVDGL